MEQQAERVIASLGKTCKVFPIRTNYPERARRKPQGKLAFPNLYREVEENKYCSGGLGVHQQAAAQMM